MAGGYDGTIRIDTKMDGQGFNNGIQNAIRSLNRLAVAIGLTFSLAAVVAFGRSAVQSASDATSAMIGLRSVVEGVGQSYDSATEFIQQYIADGLVPLTNATTAYRNLAARGYTEEQIQSVMNALKDSAAFGRQSSLTLGQAVQSATEGLKNENSILVDNAGVTRNVSLMWQDYAESIGTTVANLTQDQKIQAEVNGILNETRFQTGDAARLAGTYAGQVGALATSWYNLKVAIGNTIIPIVSAVLPYLKAAIDMLVVWFNTVAQIISAFFGVNLAGAIDSMSTLSETTSDAADAEGQLATNTTKATKAARGALAAWDELNVLQRDTSTPSDASTSTPTTGTGTAATTEATQTSSVISDIQARVLAFKDALIAFFQPVIDGFNRLKTAVTPFVQTIWAGLQWAWENILVPFGTWVFQDALPVFLDLLGAGLGVLNSVINALAPTAQWLWDNFLQPIAAWTGGAILDILRWLIGLLTDLGNWIRANPESFQNLVLIIGSIAAAIYTVIAAINIFNAVMTITKAILFAVKIGWALLTDPITLVILAIIAAIAAIVLLIAHWDDVKRVAQQVWDSIVAGWRSAGDWFRTNVTEPIRDAFQSLGNWLQGIWNGITNFARGSINSIIDFINGMIRAIAGGINAVISGMNSLRITIPSWVPGIGGSMWGMNIPYVNTPQIPRLASGAVIPPNAQFAAILGDQARGNNLEAPEGLIRQIFREELGNRSDNININFKGSMGELIRLMKPYIDREETRVGTNLIQKGATIS
jgi:hypothetical protein